MFNFVKTIKEQVEASNEIRYKIFYTSNIIEINNIKIRIFDEPLVLKASGFVFAACIIVNDKTLDVYIDENYKKCSTNAKEFILYHEVGHLVNKNLNSSPMKRSFLGLFTVDKAELEADKYAADNIGIDNVIAALKELYTMINTGEIKRRIAVMESYK
jgi:Zn-dependent peptidase ImmA (M78 family)